MERGAPRIERCDLGRWQRDHFRRAARARASNPEAARGQGRTRGRRGRGPVAERLAVRRAGARDPGPRRGDRADAAITGRARGPLGAGEDTPTPCDRRRRLRCCGRELAGASRSRARSIADRGDRHELGHDRHAQARLAVGSPEASDLRELHLEARHHRRGPSPADDAFDPGHRRHVSLLRAAGSAAGHAARASLDRGALPRDRRRGKSYRDGRRADQRDPDAQPAGLPAHGSRGRRRGSATAPGDRPALGAVDRDPDLQLLRVDGRRPARGGQPVRSTASSLDDGGSAARSRRVEDRRRRDLHARRPRPGPLLGRGRRPLRGGRLGAHGRPRLRRRVRIPSRRRPGEGHHHQGRHEHQSLRGGIDAPNAPGGARRVRGRPAGC